METLRQNARELLGIDLNDAQLEAFARFEQELLEWNERFNRQYVKKCVKCPGCQDSCQAGICA